MDGLIEELEGARKLVQIHHGRKISIIYFLTFIGCLFLLVFGTQSLFGGLPALGLFLLGALVVGLLNAWLLYKTRNYRRALIVLNTILFSLCLGLLITGGKENTGILWIYPIVAINVFINRLRGAILLYGSFLVVSALLLFTPLSQYLLIELTTTEAVRFEITLLAMWFMNVVALHFEERAYKLVSRLYGNDIQALAFFDPLTQLPNRRLFHDRLTRAIKVAQGHQHIGGLLFIDLDRFKVINDSLGHATGDAVLVEVAERLRTCVREEDSISRFGGDEFIILIPEISDSPEVAVREIKQLAARILEVLARPLLVNDSELFVSASIGISMFPHASTDAAQLIQQADTAMYRCKESGRNGYHLYMDDMKETADKRLQLEKALHSALKSDELSVVYQPQTDAGGRILGFEMLLRWHSEQLGQISPSEFIPLAEESGQIMDIGRWVILQACEQIAEWQSLGACVPGCRIAVNISSRQFSDPGFVPYVLDMLDATGADPNHLELEITEGVLIQNMATAKNKMAELRKRGISFSIDDFGTGYSSLAYLHQLPLDKLKLDQSFVAEINKSDSSAPIVRAVVAMAEHLNLSLIAEGVETRQEVDTLVEMGCDKFQGYFFYQPLPRQDIQSLLSATLHTSAGVE